MALSTVVKARDNVNRVQQRMSVLVESVRKSTKSASTFKVGTKFAFLVLCIVACTRREVTLLSAHILHIIWYIEC